MRTNLPQEEPAEFAAFQRKMLEELAPEGVLQFVFAQRVVSAAWRLARADRMETEALWFRSYEAADTGLALIRDGNGTRAIETLIRYRNAATAELTRALRTLKALQAEQAKEEATRVEAAEAAPEQPGAPERVASHPAPNEPDAPPQTVDRRAPNEPERRSGPPSERRVEYTRPEPPASGRALHEPAAPWTPNEPESGPGAPVASAPRSLAPKRARAGRTP